MPHLLRSLTAVALLAAALLFLAPGARGQVVINEFLADPGDYQGGEFVELYNDGSNSINLNGYTISDEGSTRYTFGSVTLEAGEYATILSSTDDEVPGFTDTASNLSLNNSGDVITLDDDAGNKVDAHDYAGSEVDDGVSQALNPNGSGSFESSDAFNQNGARFTPGENNETGNEPRAAAPGELIVSEFMADPSDAASEGDGEYIEIYNDASTQTRLEDYVVRDEGSNSFTINNPVVVPASGFVVLCENDNTGDNGGVTCKYDYPNGFSLNNSSDKIIIDNPGGAEITRATYTDGNTFGEGVALELAAFADARGDAQTAQADYQDATLNIDGAGDDLGSPGGLGASVTASGDPGYRMLSVPVTGVTVQDLANQNLIQGVPDSEYPDADQNFYVGYDGSGYGTPSGFTETLAPEEGIYWQLYGQQKVSQTDPLPAPIASLVGDGPATNVTADGLGQSQQFFLLGNPYDSDFDLEGLNLGSSSGFNTTVQVWNPDASGTQNGNSGSYETITQGDNGDHLAVWQGFFAERTSTGEGDTQLIFQEGHQVAGNAPFFGGTQNSSTEETSQQRRVLPLRLTGRSADGAVTSYDEAARLYFHPRARRPGAGGPDVWDATKLAPFTEGAFATIALAPGDAMKAQEGLPFAPDEKIEVPVRFDRSGAAAGETFTVTWPRSAWEHIPDDWALTLTDRETGTTVDLRERDAYTFTPADSAGAGSSTAASSSSVASAAPGQALPLDAALAERASAAEAPRFVLGVEPGALPVEVAGLRATADGRAAVFSWRTLTETDNDRFVIERKTEAGGWDTAKTVQSRAEDGASAEPIRYRARVDGLAFGTHAFRLRQIDRDGGSALVGETHRVEIAMREAYALSSVYPNPFRDRATVEVAARRAQEVTVALFDARGRRVQTLFDGALPAGETRRLTLEAGGLSSGLYVVRLRGKRGTRIQTVTLVR